MRSYKILKILLGTLGVFILFGQACSQTPLTSPWETSSDSSSGEQNSASRQPAAVSATDSPVVITGSNPNLALLTGEQLLKSFVQLTGTEGINEGNLLNAYSNRKGVFAAENDLKLTTSPMMIAATTLAGDSCMNLINKEAALPPNSRQFFNTVDFSRGLSQHSDENLKNVFEKYAQNFWSRSATSEEISLFQETLNSFKTSLPSNDLANNQNTRRWLLLSCAAALSSFDVISY